MGDVFVCAFRELKRRKGRALTNVFGYFLAVGIMVVMVNVLLFSKHAESSVLTGTGTHFMAFTPACGDVASLTPAELDGLASGVIPFRCQNRCQECTGCQKKPIDMVNEAFMANTVTTRLLPLDLVDKVVSLPEIQDASPYLLFRFRDPQDGHLFTVGGFDPANDYAVKTTCCARGDIISGRFINATDTANLVLLEQGYAQARGIEVGTSIVIAETLFEVIGIINPGVRPAKADVYMAFPQAEKVINKRIKAPLSREMNVLLVQVRSSLEQEKAIAGVQNLIQSGVITTYACYQPAVQVLGMNIASVWLISAALGLGAIFLSMKSQLTSVIERKNDIGILKAIGWTDGDVLRQILVESILQSLAGGILGCAFGAAVILIVPIKLLIGIQAKIDPFISPLVLLSGLGLALFGGIIAGVLPAIQAARQNPAEALRKV